MVVFGPEVEIQRNELQRPLLELLQERLSPKIIREVGVVKVIVYEFKNDFFENFVQDPLESGKFGELPYGAEHILKTTISTEKSGWVLSDAVTGEFPDSTIKELVHELRESWDTLDSQQKELLESPKFAFSQLDNWIQNSTVKYPESFDGLTNQSPFDGIVTEGDLNLPFDLHMVDPRLEELFHNYIQAPGMTWPWTYIYGPKSSTLFHMEDALLASVNLNCGPGNKNWWCIPRKEIFKVLAYFAVRRPGACGHEYFNKRLAPTVQDLMSAGIEVLFFQQKPGELLFLDCAVLHQVINTGWGISIAKNVLTESWLEWGLVGLWLRKQCCNSDCRNPENSMFLDVTQRFERLMARLKSRNSDKCAIMDTNAMEYLESVWTPVNEIFRGQYGVIGRGQPINWTFPKPKTTRKTLCFYSDLKGFTRFYTAEQKEDERKESVRKIVPVRNHVNRYRIYETEIRKKK